MRESKELRKIKYPNLKNIHQNTKFTSNKAIVPVQKESKDKK